MISAAIYELLNTDDINALVNDISPVIAKRDVDPPYIVFNENGTPENFKGGYKIVLYDLQIDIYAKKGLDNAAGVATLIPIYTEIERALNRYSGTVAGVDIDNIYQVSKDMRYDPLSEKARVTIEYNVRVKETAPIPVVKGTIIMINNKALIIGQNVMTI